MVRMIGESLSTLGFILIALSVWDLSTLPVMLIGIGMVATGVWLCNCPAAKNIVEREERTAICLERGDLMWPRWTISACSGILLLIMVSPDFLGKDGEEGFHVTFIALIFPVAAVVLFSALGLFSLSFVVGMWVSLVLFTGGPLSLLLACPMWMIPLFVFIRGVVRKRRNDPSEPTQV